MTCLDPAPHDPHMVRVGVTTYLCQGRTAPAPSGDLPSVWAPTLGRAGHAWRTALAALPDLTAPAPYNWAEDPDLADPRPRVIRCTGRLL